MLPPGTDLLGGGGGLERRVEWACALRTRPPAFEAVKGGEIAFVPVKSIRLLDERLDLPQVMVGFAEWLAARGVRPAPPRRVRAPYPPRVRAR